MGRTSPTGMLRYQSGAAYFGQMLNFEKHGVGKLINMDGSYFEGTFEKDKLQGKNCKIYDDITGDYYIGSTENDKKSGMGMCYINHTNCIYEGEFVNDRM